ncbi:MAG: polyisoprenyl-teichoic acid--peptidoglycan teichoic acid transferase [Solirubrobacteraceae bacterium]|jgi:LCP family protein required for cell wall assembly|nr:polyisoprenyl-teichoic acid--peptidoglycan teichoic acid transferase [Solirubrobacteraceae bacterium]MEA2357259.1 polyisoprenyl-teichoic acid--peptidoglycan teichoic acid transferase [Solirubrobacteraceae bacterium]MEA2395484.1 polyisoprenyl-teichoic acid--peptidoglycan teichoic acid transferase [Solirubrobacteraceae bacterium]
MSSFEDKPPRLAFGMYKRFALAAVIISVLGAGTVASAGLLEVNALVTIVRQEGHVIPNIKGALDDVPAGKPQTILVLGSDRRFVDIKQDNPARSDTIMLVRLDPSKDATAVMSIPRDLKAAIPGHGETKINAAYSFGGPALAVKTVRNLLHIPINHVVNVNFGGFQRAVNRLGCVYVDVDRRYYHSNAGLPPSAQYAEINIPAGYQKLCGKKSLDYVRFRHEDDDLVRSARQQDFLRQAKDQIGLGRIFGDRTELLKIFGRYTDTDLHSDSAILRLLKLAFESSGHPIREVHFGGTVGPEFVTITPPQLDRTKNEFLNVQASSGSRQIGQSASRPARPTSRRERRAAQRGAAAGLAPGLISDRTRAENYVAQASTHLDFPVYYPRVRLGRGSYVGQGPRVYDIYDRGHHRHRAYRMVLSTGLVGQYYGVQGMSWTAPPILDDPSDKVKMRGRTYQLFYDGSRLRLVAWLTPHAVYWVSNTLSETLTNRQMLGIARSLSRIGAR